MNNDITDELPALGELLQIKWDRRQGNMVEMNPKKINMVVA